MNNSVCLGYQDALLSQILAGSNPAGALFEAYRIRADKEAFVAALIGRLCVLEVQKRVNQQEASSGAVSRYELRPDRRPRMASATWIMTVASCLFVLMLIIGAFFLGVSFGEEENTYAFSISEKPRFSVTVSRDITKEQAIALLDKAKNFFSSGEAIPAQKISSNNGGGDDA